MKKENNLKKPFYITLGLTIVIGVAYALLVNWANFLLSFVTVVKGGIVLFVLMIAIVFMLLGVTEL